MPRWPKLTEEERLVRDEQRRAARREYMRWYYANLTSDQRAARNARARARHVERSRDPEYVRRRSIYNRAHSKGASRDEIRGALDNNNGTCDLCGDAFKPHRNGSDGRHVDHRHDNGRIRGVVCASCNRALAVADRGEAYVLAVVEFSKRGSD